MFSFNHSVMSNSLQYHVLQHARLPCPSPTSGACSNSSPLSWWCHPTISSSVAPFSCSQKQTHSRILAWRTPMDKSLAGYSLWGCKRLDTTEQLSTAQVQENEPCWSSWYMVPVYFTETYISNHDDYNRPISLYTHIFNFSLIWQMF